MKVYVLDPFFPTGVEYAAQRAEIVRWDDPRVSNWHEDADGVMVRMTPIGVDDLARVKKLRVIAKQGVGLDTIDLVAARARHHRVPDARGQQGSRRRIGARARAQRDAAGSGIRSQHPLGRRGGAFRLPRNGVVAKDRLHRRHG